MRYKTLLVILLGCHIAGGQTYHGDTVVEGDLDVKVDPTDQSKGGLNVDSESNLSKLPLMMPNAIANSGLSSAWQYGPVITSGRNYQVSYNFSKTASSDGEVILDLPVGNLNHFSGAEVYATINDDGVANWSREGAKWILSGSRQRDIKCLNHVAYGAGKGFSLKGSMVNGKMLAFLDYTEGLIAGVTYSIHVTVNCQIGEFSHATTGYSAPIWDVAIPASLSQGNSIQPVRIIESTVYEKNDTAQPSKQRGEEKKTVKHWNGTEMRLDGDVILLKVQGDISMGIYGAP